MIFIKCWGFGDQFVVVSSVPQIVSVFSLGRQQWEQHVTVISPHALKQRVVCLSEQFCNRWSVGVAETKSLATTQKRVNSVAVSCQTETGPGWSSVQQFGQDSGLEHCVQCMSGQTVRLQCPQRVHGPRAR